MEIQPDLRQQSQEIVAARGKRDDVAYVNNEDDGNVINLPSMIDSRIGCKIPLKI